LPLHHDFTLERRDDLPQDLIAEIGNIYRVLDGARLKDIEPIDQRYPIPYSEDFYANLLAYETRLEDRDFAHYLTDKYMQQKVVVLIESKSEVADIHEITMFNQLAFSALMKDIGLRLIAPEVEAEIKVVSSLGIYAFDEAIAALNFAQTFRQELDKQDLTCRIGIDRGEVLIFNLAIGTKDIAGMPVNVASKMAQDRGGFGKLYLSSSLKDSLLKDSVDVSKFREIKYQVSGVEITAYEG
jgi:hypothetical protein